MGLDFTGGGSQDSGGSYASRQTALSLMLGSEAGGAAGGGAGGAAGGVAAGTGGVLGDMHPAQPTIVVEELSDGEMMLDG